MDLLPPPDVPGLGNANLMIRVRIDRKLSSSPPEAEDDGVERFSERTNGVSTNGVNAIFKCLLRGTFWYSREIHAPLRFMALPGGRILAAMAQDGWEVNELEGKDLFEVLLPSVEYELPGGGMVSMPAPRFVSTVRDNVTEGPWNERMMGDLVLQNGEDILRSVFKSSH